MNNSALGLTKAGNYTATMNPTIQEKEEQAFFDEALAEALRITDRFVAEPVFARTGQGVLLSRGVEGLKADEELLRASAAAKPQTHGKV